MMPQTPEASPQVIVPPGKPHLIALDSNPKELIIQTPARKLVSIQRHWNKESNTTEVCRCNPLCPSSRTDTFASVLEWVGPLTYEQRIWCASEQAMAMLWRLAFLKGLGKEVQGMRIRARRHGDRQNGRVLVEYLGNVHIKSEGFDVPYAVLKTLGIAEDFFGTVPMEPTVPNVDQVVTPARARTEKPRVSKGCGNCHKPKEG